MPGVTCDFVTLADGASLQGLVIQDLVRPATHGRCRRGGLVYDTPVTLCRRRLTSARSSTPTRRRPGLTGPVGRGLMAITRTARAVPGLGASHTIHHPLARWWGRHLRHQLRQRKPHRAALARERRQQAWRQRRGGSARLLDCRCDDVDSVDWESLPCGQPHADLDRLGNFRGGSDPSMLPPPRRRRDIEQQALDALR